MLGWMLMLLFGIGLCLVLSRFVPLKFAFETLVLLSKLTLKLLKTLGPGCRWMLAGVQLLLYVGSLLPAFSSLIYWYLSHEGIFRDIRYGRHERNYVDVFVPARSPANDKNDNDDNHNDSKEKLESSPITKEQKHPVVLFVPGGCWVLGHRGWGVLLGQRLSERGIMTVSCDYRNFPQGTISAMIADVTQALQWVLNNIDHYGGDRDQIWIVGQSAGAHIASLVMLNLFKTSVPMPINHIGDALLRPPIQGFFGISGAYDLVQAETHFVARGLSRKLLHMIMEGEQQMPLYDPVRLLSSSSASSSSGLGYNFTRFGSDRKPKVVLFHGKADKTVSYTSSERLAVQLRRHSFLVKECYLERVSHTDPILERCMGAGYGETNRDLLIEEMMLAVDPTRFELVESLHMLPRWLVRFAQCVNPFN